MSNIVTIDGIPVYQALVEGEDSGMLRISLVDAPAVQSDFVAFAKEQRRLLYAVQDEEKRLVLGVVMRADFPIYRRSAEMGEFYVLYKADTIRKMAEKYLAENRQNLVNIMHEDGSDVEGVQMVQYFIKGNGLAPEGFDEIADGSLFAEFHVTNDEIWNDIKAGTYKGFSLEGYFELVPERDKDRVQEIVDILDGVFTRINPNFKNMSKRKGLLARLAKALVEMGNITTDRGILAWDGEEDLEAGDAVYIEDAEGNRSAAEDGEYTTEDGKVIVVAGGKVAEIRDPKAEVAPEEAAPAEEAAEEVKAGSVNTDKGVLEWDGEEDLKEGDEVFVTDEEGNRVAAPDGDYVTEDGKTIAVVEGKVASITDPAAEVAEEEGAEIQAAAQEDPRKGVFAALRETFEDKYRRIYDAIVAQGFDPYGWLLEAGEDFAIYQVWLESGEVKYFRFKIAEWDEEGNPVLENGVEVVPAFVTPEERDTIDAEFAAEKTAREAAEGKVAELEAEVVKLQNTPAGKPAHEEVEEAPLETGNKHLDRLSRLASAK